MNVRELAEGVEYICDDEGETIKCPACGAIWMKDVEGDVEHGSCPHLRFVFYPDRNGPFDIYNEWQGQNYTQRIEETITARIEDEYFDYCDVFRNVPEDSIDEVVYFYWGDSPLVQWEIYWGYSRKGEEHV